MHKLLKFKAKVEVFSVVHIWAKDYVKYHGCDVEAVHIFLSGSVGTGKSLWKVAFLIGR